ncbi:hypothetical protein pdam_00025030 [Pocillopora damicornis]|uniref:Uncharacterized protein n=1 Tax=Pocillopora damicornis TaxID=46731 RepID=A0A3M6U4H8_POCDA|nr:hypothetical protein pdam_00025030 [Pocillopora damicornis]
MKIDKLDEASLLHRWVECNIGVLVARDKDSLLLGKFTKRDADLFDPLYSGFFKGKWVFVILTVERCGLQDSQDNSLRDFSIKWVNNLFKCGSIIQRKLTHFCAHGRVLGWGFSHHGHHTHVHRGIQGYHTEMESEFYVLCIVLDFFSRQIGFPSKEKSNWVETDKVETHFLFVEDVLKDSTFANAETIVNILIRKLDHYGLQLQKLSTIASNGAAVVIKPSIRETKVSYLVSLENGILVPTPKVATLPGQRYM